MMTGSLLTQRLLKEGIIEPSNSPWQDQVVVTRNENHKKRLVIDYSQTINDFTMLDAYPLPILTILSILCTVQSFQYH